MSKHQSKYLITSSLSLCVCRSPSLSLSLSFSLSIYTVRVHDNQHVKMWKTLHLMNISSVSHYYSLNIPLLSHYPPINTPIISPCIENKTHGKSLIFPFKAPFFKDVPFISHDPRLCFSHPVDRQGIRHAQRIEALLFANPALQHLMEIRKFWWISPANCWWYKGVIKHG